LDKLKDHKEALNIVENLEDSLKKLHDSHRHHHQNHNHQEEVAISQPSSESPTTARGKEILENLPLGDEANEITTTTTTSSVTKNGQQRRSSMRSDVRRSIFFAPYNLIN
jgi:hypothetical protein